jgi:acetoin utilization protein AcuB
MLVESIMIRDVVTVTPDTTVEHALLIAKHSHIRHLPVVKDGYLVGLVSDRDLRDAAPSTLEETGEHACLNTTVDRLMMTSVHTSHPFDFVEDAALQIYRHRIGCLPVVTQGKLVGIVSERDILHTLVEMMGVNAPTSRVEVEMPDRPGMLAAITDFLRARRTNTSAVMVFPSPVEGYKRIVFRINTMDPRRFIQDIEAAGYQVVQHPSALNQGEV